MNSFHDLVCAICDGYIETRPKRSEPVTCPDFAAITLVTGPTFSMPCLTHEQMQSCPYTTTFALTFQDWIRHVQWGDGEPISALEMYITFAMDTGVMAPVQVKDKVYQLRTESVIADQIKLDLSRQPRVWINFLQWWLDRTDAPIRLQSGKALRPLGFTIAVRGFNKRPRLNGSAAALVNLWMYFQQTVGKHKTGMAGPGPVRARGSRSGPVRSAAGHVLWKPACKDATCV